MYFISAYTGRSYHRNQRYRRLAASVYVGLLIIKLTNPLYGLYVSTELQQSPYTHLVVEPQLFYWVSFSLTYTLVAISFYWVIKTLRQSPFPSGGISALAVLALFPIVPRAAISILPNEVLPPIMLGLSFEPIGVTAFLMGCWSSLKSRSASSSNLPAQKYSRTPPMRRSYTILTADSLK